MKQASYSLVEFLEDPDFIAWVKHPDETRNAYWQRFVEVYPTQKPVIESARQYVLQLVEQTSQNQPSAFQTESMQQTIQKHIREERMATPFTRTTGTGTKWGWMRVAASIMLVLGLGTTGYWYTQSQANQPESYQQFVQASPQGIALRETRNDTDEPLTIFLSDGSSVVLQAGSQLSYPDTLKKREVYLVGKAFFEIVKDPARPFLVYTRGVATKVLGTSFMIDAPESNQPIKVAVKTGKVAVYALNESTSVRPKVTDSELSGIVLTPNQSAEYMTASHRLVRTPDTVLAFTQPGTQVVAKQSFDFDETPVSEVFNTLERAYGVHIVYNESLLGTCTLSALLVGQPFNEKLSVICKALGAQHTIEDHQVIITGGQRCQ
ncbi:FecR family protein [Spirosoma flavum]|uniref:FecR family protein n=1 Tax=Spirosoma flavum TaxID=2048557 RepID=A0ABW6AFM0_9BACT